LLSAVSGGWLHGAESFSWSQACGVKVDLSDVRVAATEIFHWPETGLSCV
jgi:hypothetical protein